MYAGHRLPGIHVDLPPPAVADDRLPRMDVAVFVGIAERGPCHRPVRVDSVAAFGAVFGGTVNLAFDPAAGETLTANLAPSVRAFFSNGGHECWVIRVAWTTPLREAWAAAGQALPDGAHARAGLFPLSGLLARLPGASDDESHVEHAVLSASSVGAWADDLQLAARVRRTGFSFQHAARHRWGLRFSGPPDLHPGDVIELQESGTETLTYAKIVHAQDGEYWAAWCSAFRRIEDRVEAMAGSAFFAARSNPVDAEFTQGVESTLELSRKMPHLVRGCWVRFLAATGKPAWLRADHVDGKIAWGPAWRQVPARFPDGPFVARRLTIEIQSRLHGEDRSSGDLGLSPEARQSLFALTDDDRFYAPADRRQARARLPYALSEEVTAGLALGPVPTDLASGFVAGTLTEAERPLLRAAFMPLGISGEFDTPTSVQQADDRPPLERSGLVPFDHRLFVDPVLAGRTMQEIDRMAVQRHDMEEKQLFGMHAAYDIPGESVGEASIIAVPDGVQPGWSLRDDDTELPRPQSGPFAPANWFDHTGACLIEDRPPLSAPDFGNFLDGTVAVLARPGFGVPRSPVRGGSIQLSFSSADANVTFVLEEASRHDFADAAEIWRGNTAALVLQDRAEGPHYFRLRTERDGNVSPFAVRRVILRSISFVTQSGNLDEMRKVHVALLRLAAGSAALTALLSLPRSFQADEAQAYIASLVSFGHGNTALRAREERALSYGAVFHPWLAGVDDDALLTVPPDGAVAGQMARIAREDGAWIAPANRDFADIVALYPDIAQADRGGSDRARINLILPRARGFAAHAARSLSAERGWGQVNVRRLFIMLRRLLLTLGRTYLFETNGPATRRAIERAVLSNLGLLQRRGAFAGASSADSYFVRMHDRAQDRDEGRVIAEIGIAPSHPLEFIEISLVQQGARLTLAEVV